MITKEKIQKQIEIIREEIRLAQDSGQPLNDLLHQCMELEVQKKTLSAEIWVTMSPVEKSQKDSSCFKERVFIFSNILILLFFLILHF